MLTDGVGEASALGVGAAPGVALGDTLGVALGVTGDLVGGTIGVAAADGVGGTDGIVGLTLGVGVGLGAWLARDTTETVPPSDADGSLTTISAESSGAANTVDAFWSSLTGRLTTVVSVAHGSVAVSGQTSLTLRTLTEDVPSSFWVT